jgi:hypothetical protein
MQNICSIDKSKKLDIDINFLINELQIKNDDRSKFSAACYHVALDHHAGVRILFENSLHSPALALSRPLYEAFVRGSWLQHCATDNDIENFKIKGKTPAIAKLLESLEKIDGFESKALSEAHGNTWSELCDLTHTGIGQVLLSLSDNCIERNCPDDLRDKAMARAGFFALMSGIGVARLADDADLMEKLSKLGETFLTA